MTQEIVEHISDNSGRLPLAVTCIGVGVVLGLGINKDLEPLARRVKKLGGAVEITRSNHVRWVLPDGTVLRTGLTMHDTTSRQRMRAIESSCRPGNREGPSPAPYET
jgi:hypothetical protein